MSRSLSLETHKAPYSHFLFYLWPPSSFTSSLKPTTWTHLFVQTIFLRLPSKVDLVYAEENAEAIGLTIRDGNEVQCGIHLPILARILLSYSLLPLLDSLPKHPRYPLSHLPSNLRTGLIHASLERLFFLPRYFCIPVNA